MNLGCSSEQSGTSSSTTDTKKIPRHVVNLKESKTHLFYVIQSDNDSHENAQRVVQLKVSKESLPARRFLSQKMRLRCNNDDDVNREKLNRTQIPSRLASIHKRTDHPSFVVLPEVFSRGRVNKSRNIEKNQSTSENSNETYVIRSENKSKIPTLFTSLWKRNATTADAAFLHGLHNLTGDKKTEDFCECDKVAPNRSRNSLKADKNDKTGGLAQNATHCFRKKDQFNIDYVEATSKDMPQRLRAGQDYDKRYKSCNMCPNMTRIFPPTSSRRRTRFQSNSDSTLDNRGGYAKINFKLVRRCLLNGSPNEKTEILDAIRMRMRSADCEAAIGTIEDIIKFDLFGVQCECRSKPLLEDLLWPLTPSYELQTSTAQFVNALVSYKTGRGYFNNRSIIGMLTWGDIGRDNIDKIMGDNLMGIMMKLSLSRFQRTDMIDNGLMLWLLQHMEEEEFSASKYHLQCMTGLLRNLLRGFNLESFSSVEQEKMIVLLGRYLEHENAVERRYICDSLLVLFQSTKLVASAKDLNFPKIIQEHVNQSSDPVQKVQLRAIYRLLNGSSTSPQRRNDKIDYRSEDEPFLDADLEPSGEVDCYPGECLIREKFTGDGDTQRQDETVNESKADDSLKRDKLIARVFVEHLNSFLPNIQNNRIFPLCNARCADKIKTCSHVGDIPSRKRQPYIPPNSRLSRQKQSTEDSTQGKFNVSYSKPMTKSKLDNESIISEPLISRVSTISHDRTAAKWDHIGGESSDEKLTTSTSDGGAMKKIFGGHSKGADNREEVTSNVSYHHYSYDASGVSNERTKNNEDAVDELRRREQNRHTEKATKEDRDRAAKTKDPEDSQRDAANTERIKTHEVTPSAKDTKETRNRENLLTKTTSDMEQNPAVGSVGLDRGVQKNETDKEDRSQLSPSKVLEATDDFRREKRTDPKQKTAFKESGSGESVIGLSIDRNKDKTQSGQTPIDGNKANQGIRFKSEERLSNLDEFKENSRTIQAMENVDKNKIGGQFPVRSKDVVVETRSGRGRQLNVRSSRVPQKTTEVNAKVDGNETGARLRVRSEENVRGRGEHLKKSKSTDGKLGLTLQARSELFSVNTATGNKNQKLKSVRSATENLVEGTVAQNILNVRSENLVLKQRGTDDGLPTASVESRTARPTLLARSMEVVKDAKDKLLRTSKSDVVNVDSSKMTTTDKAQTGTQFSPRTPPISQRTNVSKRQNVFGREQQARSVDRTNYQLFKSSSDELLGSTKNQDYALEPIGRHNWTSRTNLSNQFAVRSKEFVGRTQSATFEGQKDSRRRINSSSTKHCVDCKNDSGYVLRARPSQPCDRCTVSLTKYPDFVDALGNQDYHRRVVTRTDDEWIKTDFTNKTDAKSSTKPKRKNPNAEKLGHSKIGEQSVKENQNATGNVAKTSGSQEESSTEKFDKKAMQSSIRTENLDRDGNNVKDSLDKSETIFEDKNSTSNIPGKTADDETFDALKDYESVEDELVTSGKIKKCGSDKVIQNPSDDCIETNPNTMNQWVDRKVMAKLQPPVLQSSQTEKLTTKDVSDDKSQITTNHNRGEHLVFATFIETASPILVTDPTSVEMNANFESDFRLIPKSIDEKAAGPSTSKPSKQIDKKDELIENYQHVAAVNVSEAMIKNDIEADKIKLKMLGTPKREEEHKLDEGKSGTGDAEIKLEFTPEDSEKLSEMSATKESGLLTSDGTKMDNKDIEKERSDVGWEEGETLQEGVDSCQIFITASTNDISRSEPTVDKEVAETKTTEQQILPPQSTEVTALLRPTNDRDDTILSTSFSQTIGEAISSQSSLSQLIVNKNTVVTDDGQLKVLSNEISTSNDKQILDETPDSQLSERPVALHLFPRSNELAGVVRSSAVNNNDLKSQSAPCDATKHRQEETSDTATSSFKEKNETVDRNIEKNDSKNQLSVFRPDEEVPVNVQCSSRAASKRQQEQIYINLPSSDAKSETLKGEYSESPDNQPSKTTNEINQNIELTVLEDDKISIGRSLKREYPNKVADISEQRDNQPSISSSLRQEEQNKQKRDIIIPIPFENVRWIGSLDQKTRKSHLTTKPNDAKPIGNRNQNEQENGKESVEITVKKPIENKSSTVLDEAFVEERDLHSDRQAAHVQPDGTEIDRGLDLEGVGYFSDGNIERECRNVKVVNSTCCRRLLNNDDLINRLSEKVLEKLKSKIHQCGPNCKSPCGGLNSLFNTKNDNNLNWE